MKKKSPFLKRLKIEKFWPLYAMMIFVLVWYILFCYVPMYGVLIAFEDGYTAKKGILGSEWVGLANFKEIFAAVDFSRAIKNTLVISFLKIICCFPIPIIMALFLEEIRAKRVKKMIQNCIYLPYFISWVVIGGLVKTLFKTDGGLINMIRVAMGHERIEFLTEPKYFYPILIFATIWKEAGWGTIIYTAAISGIDSTLYESAQLDGCNRFQQVLYVTVPCLSPIIIMMFILAIGGMMNAGFDSIFNLYSKPVYEVADILDTYLYRIGMSDGEFELSTALGLFKSVINFALLMCANKIVKKVNGYGIYDSAR